MIEAIKRLRHLLSMPEAEVKSRANAWAEVQAAGRELIEACQGEGSVTSAQVAAIASRTLKLSPVSEGEPPSSSQYNLLLTYAHTLAGSALSQYPGDDNLELKGQSILKEEQATRALVDAQKHGQAHPLVETVVIRDGPARTDKEA